MGPINTKRRRKASKAPPARLDVREGDFRFIGAAKNPGLEKSAVDTRKALRRQREMRQVPTCTSPGPRTVWLTRPVTLAT